MITHLPNIANCEIFETKYFRIFVVSPMTITRNLNHNTNQAKEIPTSQLCRSLGMTLLRLASS